MSAKAQGSKEFAVGRVELPWSTAFSISKKNIMVRFGRAMITAAGIMLGIAFLMSVFTSKAILMGSGEPPSPEQETRQTWLIVMSLLVCSVGICNSMFMSVTERFREIGTMKCLGAVDAFVVKLFLLESGMLGFLGSLIGAVAGFLVVCIVHLLKRQLSQIASMDWAYFGMGVVEALVIGMLLSMAATIAPAVKAARLPPAAALRTDV